MPSSINIANFPVGPMTMLTGVLKGVWVAETTYNVGEVVTYNGGTYILNVAATAGTLPTDTTKWQTMNSPKEYVESLNNFALVNTSTDNTISVDQNGNVGTDVTTDGAIHIENTGNTGIGLGVYTNIGATADAPLVSIQAANAAFDQNVVFIKNDSASNGLQIHQAAVLGSNKSALHIYSDAAQNASYLTFFRLGSASAAVNIATMNVESAGEATAIRVSAAVGPHIRFVGDSPNSTPTDGDMWFDGTNLKMYIGTTIYNVDMTAA